MSGTPEIRPPRILIRHPVDMDGPSRGSGTPYEVRVYHLPFTILGPAPYVGELARAFVKIQVLIFLVDLIGPWKIRRTWEFH